MTTKQFYETYWSREGFRPQGFMTPALAAIFERTIRPGWRCLDVGCGDGGTSGVWLRAHGCDYVGVDISENAVRDARARGLNVRTIPEATSLPFDNSSFDAVVCIEVLEHLFEPHVAAVEILRVLKPGGRLLATVPNVAYWRRRLELGLVGLWNPLGDLESKERPWRDPHIRFFNPRTLQRMLSEVGFSAVRVGGHGGGFLMDLPFIGKHFDQNRTTRLYRAAEARLPALFGCRLHAVAYKAT